MTDVRDLAALTGSRICHDLISPLGAIGNGVELLQMTIPGEGPPELRLIADSVRSANARIRFLRVCFGVAGEGQLMGPPELAGLVRDWAEGGRLQVDWAITEDCTRQVARRGLLALLCLETAMPYGGQIRASESPGTWRFEISGRRLRSDDACWDLLCEAKTPEAALTGLSAARVQFAHLRQDLLEGPGLARLRRGEDFLHLDLPSG